MSAARSPRWRADAIEPTRNGGRIGRERVAEGTVAEATIARAGERGARYPWVIVALLFAATAINYVARRMMGVLKPTLSAEFGWSEGDYAGIVFWFQLAYAIGYISFGRVVDVVGARVGYTIAIVIWTVSHMAHGLATGITSFAAARFGLGIGESGNFPAGIRAVTDWFPQRERALAIGLFNAGANVGAIITPLLVPALVLSFGWRAAFYITGLFGVAWLIVWWLVYRDPAEHPHVTQAELDWIRHDQAPTPAVAIGWGK